MNPGRVGRVVFEDRLSYEGREKRARAGRSGEVPGEDLGRIISLSDGVFAFALTLLVLSLTVPTLVTANTSSSVVSSNLARALQSDWQKFFGYAFAFVMIGIWWVIHHRTFRYIQRYDWVLMWLNMIVLLEVAVMPFVLSVYTTYSDAQVAVALFASMQVVIGLTMNALWRYASRGHRLIDPKLKVEEIRYYANRGLLTPIAFGVSIAISFVSVPWAQYVWFIPLLLSRLSHKYGVD